MATDISDPVLAEHAAAIRALGRRFITDVIEIGHRLSQCRAILKDDRGWRAWLEQELRLSPQSAGRYIQVAELAQKRSKLEHNLERSGLSVSAVYLLAAPSTPEEARDTILARAEAGAVLPIAEIKQTIDAAKGRKQPARKITTKPPQVSEEVLQQRAAAAERIRALMGGTTRDDIGPNSSGEIARKDSRIEELENQVRRLEHAAAGRLEDDDGEGLGALLLAWDRASESAREKFKARVGLVAAEND